MQILLWTQGRRNWEEGAFESGLRKFAPDPVVDFFFKKWQRNYKSWSDPVNENFFEMHLIQLL